MRLSLKPWALQPDRKTLSSSFFLVALRRQERGKGMASVPHPGRPLGLLFRAGLRHLVSHLSRMIRGAG